jgi:lysophospholipase L1-like esterase
MITRRRLVFLTLILLFPLASVKAQERKPKFYLTGGERVVFYGDSITEQRLYTSFVESYVLTRFPNMKVTFVQSGWGGDRVSGGGRSGGIERRLERDVIPYKPTVITIMLGMNDGAYQPFNHSSFETYAAGYDKIVKLLKQALPGAQLTLIEPSPYDDVTRPPLFVEGYNSVLIRFGQFVKELAKREKFKAADLNTPVVAALRTANLSDAALAQKIFPDRVHPTQSGHLLMAAALLKAWNAPSLVSFVEIDAVGEANARTENTQVSELAMNAGALSWVQTDRALPMPLEIKDALLALAIHSSDVVESLDKQVLRVKNLVQSNYVLMIDGERIADFKGRTGERG